MFAIPEQFSNATKATIDAQLALLTSLTQKTFSGVEKIVDLNLNLARTSLAETTASAQQLLSANGPQEFLSMTTAQAQPNAEKVLAYGRHLAEIMSGTQAEFTKAAEEQFSETKRKAVALFEDVSKNAPAGSENAIAMIKTAISNANAGYEQFSKATRQAGEAVEANLSAAATQFAKTTEKATARAKK